jgi:hypothetical protein
VQLVPLAQLSLLLCRVLLCLPAATATATATAAEVFSDVVTAWSLNADSVVLCVVLTVQ